MMLMMMMMQDHVVYNQFNGIVLAEEEGRNIATALGSKKAALLQNHGLLFWRGMCIRTLLGRVRWFGGRR